MPAPDNRDQGYTHGPAPVEGAIRPYLGEHEDLSSPQIIARERERESISAQTN